ncbi:CRISPR-associated endonuclease Cas2 [Haloferax namakaokahaiae]|uniref:CRISPR-associated endoribonuclease Cas2 n=1 Tax=Haloferax namakaokahaiae TaxID=1748331 RepID=A0ABD5ZIR8_9EURY
MFVLIVYDVPAGRTERYKKMLRRRLEHVQYSVFYGDVTPGLLVEIKNDIEDLLQPDDSIIVFEAERVGAVDLTTYGDTEEPGSRFT